jgi:hypothetical protein
MVATRLAPYADRQSASQSASLFNPDRARGEGRSYGVARLSVRATAGRRSEGGSPRAAEAWRGRSDAPPSVAAGRGGDDGGGPPPPARDAQRDAPGGDATTPGRRRHTPRPHGPGSIADHEVPSPFPLHMWMRRRTPSERVCPSRSEASSTAMPISRPSRSKSACTPGAIHTVRASIFIDLLQEGLQLRTGISMATAIVSKGGAFRPQSLSSLIPSIGARIKSRFRGPNLRLLDLTMAAAKAAPTKKRFL